MKLVNLFLLAFLFSTQILTSETKEVTITTGEGYQNTVWYSLINGLVKEAPKDNWDLAFQTGQNGSILLNCQKGYELFEIFDSDEFSWDSPIDTTDFRGSKNFVHWLNSEETWNSGAFNLGKDGFISDGDFGWGSYDMGDHGIKGTRVFLLITPEKKAKKIFIYKLLNRKYEFKYANLDGTDEVYATVNKNDRPDVSFIYFDFSTNTILPESREPNSNEWDLVFGKYMINYPIGDGTYMPYGVTGIKQNQNVLAIQLDDVNVDTVEDPGHDLYDPNITTIGSDWKEFDMATYTYNLAEDRAYFVEDLYGAIFKLVFTDFSGSTDGKYVFNQTRMGTSVSETMSNVKLAVYPNVIDKNESFSIVLSDEFPQTYNLSVVDLTGNKVLTKSIESDYLKNISINASNIASGVYFINISNANGILTQKLIVR